MLFIFSCKCKRKHRKWVFNNSCYYLMLAFSTVSKSNLEVKKGDLPDMLEKCEETSSMRRSKFSMQTERPLDLPCPSYSIPYTEKPSFANLDATSAGKFNIHSPLCSSLIFKGCLCKYIQIPLNVVLQSIAQPWQKKIRALGSWFTGNHLQVKSCIPREFSMNS